MIDVFDAVASSLGGSGKISRIMIIVLMFFACLAFAGMAIGILFLAYELINDEKGVKSVVGCVLMSLPLFGLSYLSWRMCKKGFDKSEKKW